MHKGLNEQTERPYMNNNRAVLVATCATRVNVYSTDVLHGVNREGNWTQLGFGQWIKFSVQAFF